MSLSPDLRDALPSLLTIHDIASLFQIHRTAAYARTRDPEFPDPLVISGSCYRWYSHEVLAYLDSRRTPKKVHRSHASVSPSPHVATAPASVPRARRSRRPRGTSTGGT